jgi:methylenetetrahydrofolate reductase (NADPH)
MATNLSTTAKDRLSEVIYNPKKINISFEFFPPKNVTMEEELWQSITSLANLQPEFVSVTFGAGGSTRERTHNTIARIIKETALKPAPHLTCVASSKQEIEEIARNYWDIGVKHIVALRGDMPSQSPNYQLHPNGYNFANELVYALKKIANFEISVAGYPEKHPEARDLASDIDNLKRKVDAGADRVITQFFFDTEYFFEFINLCEKKQIKTPIVPGILPVANITQVQHFAKMCGTKIPEWLNKIFYGLEDKTETRKLIATVVAVEISRILYQNGVNNFHFYTLNRSDITTAICHILGVSNNPLINQ